jgi:hypothetical protein
MSKPAINLSFLFIVLFFFSTIGCASGPRGKLKRVQQPTETGLKQDWQNYTVYHRPNLAFVYKIRNGQKIILDKRWVEVSSEDMMAKSKILFSTWVKEILGQNDELYGYLVHRYQDQGYVGIVDENTIKLRYRYVVTSGGP